MNTLSMVEISMVSGGRPKDLCKDYYFCDLTDQNNKIIGGFRFVDNVNSTVMADVFDGLPAAFGLNGHGKIKIRGEDSNNDYMFCCNKIYICPVPALQLSLTIS